MFTYLSRMAVMLGNFDGRSSIRDQLAVLP